MWGKALNAKYSVSLCLPCLSGTLPPPELVNTDLEGILRQLLTPLVAQRKGEWSMCIGSVEQGKSGKYGKWCKEMVALVF